MDVIKGNLTNGKKGVLYWTWENGRVLQTVALFMFGMLLGRENKFQSGKQNLTFWLRILIGAGLAFGIFYTLKENMSALGLRESLAGILKLIVGTYSNFAFMLVLVSVFVLLYQTTVGQKILEKLTPLGRMSLSNYIMQSIIGAFIYYGIGLGFYEYTGATYCLLIGIMFLFLQLLFCRWWLKSHKQGPLEGLWHKATWIGVEK
jgi:uncharacterized protein